MNQIFNRLINIAKSYSNSSDVSNVEHIINADKDNLKKIIDDLNKKEEPKKETFNNSKDSYHSNNKAKTNKMTTEKAYHILEISFNCSIYDIKTAYKEKIKEYHPDKVQNLGKEIKDIAINKTKEINTAYSFLKEVRNF
jgi:DnaJ-domain-containing protein 1